MREIAGPDVQWGLEHHLLAAAVDSITLGNWQRAQVGRKRPTRMPDPIERPGMRRRTLGKTSLSNAQVKTFLARFNPPTEVTDDH